MALTFGFYDSLNGDRTYNAEQFSRFFDGIISDGVIKAVGSRFQMTPGTGLSIKVGSGRAWFNHTWTYNDSDLTVTLPAAHATLPRIDSIILSIDAQARTNSITYKQGTAASTPTAPTLEDTETLHEYRLANVSIAATATSISSEDITSTVGTEETPYATFSDMDVDYGTVANKPSVNGNVLEGNKTSSQLGITYSSMSDKPSINSVSLTGNKTTSQLNISYNDLTNRPTLNGKTISGAVGLSSGARNSTILTVNHATITWGWNPDTDEAPVLRFTANMPTPKNGMAIKKILISFNDGLDASMAGPNTGGSLSTTGVANTDGFIVITKSTNPVSGIDSYIAEVYGGWFEKNETHEALYKQTHYYDYTASMDTVNFIENEHALVGGLVSGGYEGLAKGWFHGSAPHEHADLRFGLVYWGSDNVLHYAMQEFHVDSDEAYVRTSYNVGFKLVVLE